MCIGHCWNDPDSGKSKYAVKNLSPSYFINHKFHMNWSRIEPQPQQGGAADLNMSHGTLPTIPNIKSK